MGFFGTSEQASINLWVFAGPSLSGNPTFCTMKIVDIAKFCILIETTRKDIYNLNFFLSVIGICYCYIIFSYVKNYGFT